MAMSTKTWTLKPPDSAGMILHSKNTPSSPYASVSHEHIYLPLFIQPVYVGVYISYSENVHLPVVQNVHLNQRFLCVFRLNNNN